MGREAVCPCRWGADKGEVKALLESHELILRGEIKRKVAVADLKSVTVDGDDLRFKVGRESVALRLGAKDAASWAKKIATPPPSLKEKLGLKEGAKALAIGPLKDAVLAEALKGATTTSATKAALAVAVIENDKDLAKAISACPPATPIWIVHRKGKAATFGDTPIRAAMRAKGFMDTKVSAVSADFSATRYLRK